MSHVSSVLSPLGLPDIPQLVVLCVPTRQGLGEQASARTRPGAGPSCSSRPISAPVWPIRLSVSCGRGHIGEGVAPWGDGWLTPHRAGGSPSAGGQGHHPCQPVAVSVRAPCVCRVSVARAQATLRDAWAGLCGLLSCPCVSTGMSLQTGSATAPARTAPGPRGLVGGSPDSDSAH